MDPECITVRHSRDPIDWGIHVFSFTPLLTTWACLTYHDRTFEHGESR